MSDFRRQRPASTSYPYVSTTSTAASPVRIDSADPGMMAYWQTRAIGEPSYRLSLAA
jgi:hypothetical protein